LEKDVVTCPVKYGGLLLFNNITPHQRFAKHADAAIFVLFIHNNINIKTLKRSNAKHYSHCATI